MSGKPEPKDLEAVLAKLETEWQELASLLKSQAQPQTAAPDSREADQLRVRLENLERRHRRQRVFGALLLGLVLVLLATQAFLLDRFVWRQGPSEVESLTVRNRQGSLRARLGEQDGKVPLNLWDRQGKRRAGLGPDGSPDLTFYGQGRPRAETNTPGDANNQQARTGVTTGTEEDTLASVPPREPEVKDLGVEAVAVYVGSKTSNRYHYPTCRWVKEIRPESLMKFQSVQEAREQRHPIACPACWPPRAD